MSVTVSDLIGRTIIPPPPDATQTVMPATAAAWNADR